MSDSDDTDLLLLIPPDFFLIRSPTSDSDSDRPTSFEFEQDSLKNHIVSDLITQVNDLEGRICVIENFDRSLTNCSSYFDNSFFNHSLNSLTESDNLRSPINNPECMQLRNHMLESTVDLTNRSKFLVESSVSDYKIIKEKLALNSDKQTLCNVEDDYVCENGPTGNATNKPRNKDDCSIIHTNDQIEAHYKQNIGGLLHEVDNFIELKENYKHLYPHQCSDITNLDSSYSIGSCKENCFSLKENDNLCNKDVPITDIKILTRTESPSLPTVFQLLKEMEDTQYEIENKLKHCGTDTQIEKSNTESFISNQNGHNVVKPRPISTGLQMISRETENSTPNRVSNQQGKKWDHSHSLLWNKYRTLENRRRNHLDEQVELIKSSCGNEILDVKKDSNTDLSNSTSFGQNHIVRALPYASKNYVDTDLDKYKATIGQIQSRPFQMYDDFKDNTSHSPKRDDRVCVSLPKSLSKQLPNNCDRTYQPSLVAQQTTMLKSNSSDTSVSNKPVSSDMKAGVQKISTNNLLSLSELWNKEPTLPSDDPNKLRQKLEEEKYRRQHCEQQIQALQLRVLEEQQRLAVAVNVDMEKDKAIAQITHSWRKLNDHWRELEEQRHSLAKQLQAEKELSKLKTEELTNKVTRWEKEVSQALDLAAGYKEKSESIQMQMDLLVKTSEEKLEESNSHVLALQKENERVLEGNETLMTQLDGCRRRIEEEEQLLTKLKLELEKCQKQCNLYEAEIHVLKEQKESLAEKIKEEKGRSHMLEQQKISLQQAFNEATKREKKLQEEARVSGERIEVARTELRALYQGQLEAVVKEKLQEFQCQLEAAEAQLKAELLSKEKQWADKASDQCRQLQEKHQMELYQKDESCRSEITKWKVRLIESEKMRSVSESKLEEETSRRAEIAHRLHSVMETQWREALNIISNPLLNVHEATKEEHKSNWAKNVGGAERLRGSGDMKASPSPSAVSTAQGDEVPFYKEGLETCRTAQPQPEQQLRRYIQMLLERGPGNSVSLNDSLQESLDQTFSQESTIGSRYNLENGKKCNGADKMDYSNKPPWK